MVGVVANFAEKRLLSLVAGSRFVSGYVGEPVKGVEPITYGLQNSGAPFRSVSLSSVQTCLVEFKHILLSRVFRCVPFRQRVLLAVLLADERRWEHWLRSQRSTYCCDGLRVAAPISEIQRDKRWLHRNRQIVE